MMKVEATAWADGFCARDAADRGRKHLEAAGGASGSQGAGVRDSGGVGRLTRTVTLAGGYGNRENVDALSVSKGSVENHTPSILSDQDARDRTPAVLRGIELGYLKG